MKGNKFSKWYSSGIGKVIPKYGFLSVIFCFVVNQIVYSGCQIFMKGAKHYDFTSSWDRKIPFVSQWMYIYLICFVFWGVNYILITRTGKEEWFKFATADYMSRIICGIFFILIPTTNVRPDVTGSGLSEILTRFIYSIDDATNLFPSIHCLVSWMCFIGIRGRKEIPVWYRGFSMVFALLVCASTQFTKQHYLIDVAAGLFIAELCYYITTHTNLYKYTMKIFDKINIRLFGKEGYE